MFYVFTYLPRDKNIEVKEDLDHILIITSFNADTRKLQPSRVPYQFVKIWRRLYLESPRHHVHLAIAVVGQIGLHVVDAL